MNLSHKNRCKIQHLLLDWYSRAKRNLPWRQTSNPYNILLSEFMLQQTQVATVIPYYNRFLKKFPTIQSLAVAPRADVLKTWEGLGYYARAHNLHRTAQEIVERFNSMIPTTYDNLSSLPGFGPYTTAAVLSIAFNQNHAVLDGNVTRVLCRLFGIEEFVSNIQVKNQLWELARLLLPKGNAGKYNQAIMELGALICTPKSPDCTVCPIIKFCRAYRSGNPSSLPRKPPRKIRPHHILCVGIVWRENQELLIVRRPENGLLGGLWEFPTVILEKGETLLDGCIRGVKEKTGIRVKIKKEFQTFNHVYTHFSVTLNAFQCKYLGGRAKPLDCEEVCWVPPKKLEAFAFSKANRKLIESLKTLKPIDLL